jgi:hypothetical protein
MVKANSDDGGAQTLKKSCHLTSTTGVVQSAGNLYIR